ncbi:MAG: GTP cyclohydrolase [Candidatus Margulisbacteria bacterium]|nr:GTP cyclohydrolase [Candidatus Margulisiibacteriota bacterium]
MSDDILNEYQIIDKVLGLSFKEKSPLKMGAYKTSHNHHEVEHAIIYSGNIQSPKESILLRINSACYTSDIFGCQRCDCSWQLQQAMKKLEEEPGLIIYHFHHEGKALGFTHKLKVLQALESEGANRWEASIKLHHEPDDRRFYSTLKILRDLDIRRVRLMTNNPKKKHILESHDIDVLEVIPLVSTEDHLKPYLESKRDILGHLI